MREVNPYTTTLPYLATRMALNDYYAGESVSAFEKKLCGRVAKQACRKDTIVRQRDSVIRVRIPGQ